jgi:uncharacterized protein (TIGR00730 family)
MSLSAVTVYCGSRSGSNPAFMLAAHALGSALATRKLRLVYGGAKVGLMGEVARGALEHGGEVTGVIPTWLEHREIAHDGLKDLRVVDSMHTRKKLMIDLCDGFIALPGGFGTFEELFEVFTWAQIGLHSKPIGVLNLNGYFDPARALAEQAMELGFMAKEHGALWLFDDNVESLLDRMRDFVPPPAGDPKMDRRFVK